jgi:ABC-type uncharacterized transport system permease subunit
MSEWLSRVTFALAILLYAGSSVLYYLDIAQTGRAGAGFGAKQPPEKGPYSRFAPTLLGFAAMNHAAYVGIASFVAHVCPIHSVHFFLSVASLFSTSAYLILRARFRIDTLGLLVGPLGLAFLLGTFFLGKPVPDQRFSALFIAFHVMANLLGIALFVLAGGSAGLYLVQEKRIKQKKFTGRGAALPPLDTLDHAVHRFLIAGFPLLTLGIISGTYWAQKLEFGSPEEVMRAVFGYATWLLIAGVLLLRAAAGWRGRRAAYGTLAGLAFAAAVLLIYLVRPTAAASGVGG